MKWLNFILISSDISRIVKITIFASFPNYVKGQTDQINKSVNTYLCTNKFLNAVIKIWFLKIKWVLHLGR